MFEENNFKPDEEFNFDQRKNWEKRDSEKVIRENMTGANYKAYNETNMLFQQANGMGDDEIYGYNTIPCNSIIHNEEIQSIQGEFNTINQLPIQDYAEDLDKHNSQKYQVADPIKLFAKEESKEDAIIIVDSSHRSLFDEEDDSTVKQSTKPSEDQIKTISEVAQKSKLKKKSDDESFEWNNFLIRRACFRGLSVYYKNKFAKTNVSWQRRRVNKKKKTPMHDLIKDFAIEEFGPIVERLSESKWVSFRNILYSILFSHRYKKTDDFLEGVDFKLVRGVLYSYTTDSRVELMSNPYFSLVVSNFLAKGKEEFITSKVRNKPNMYQQELKSELISLEEEADSCLKQYNFVE